MIISKEQARDYLVQYHFLDKRLPKSQVDQVFSRLQSIQFDPLNVLSRNADLVLKARLERYQPSDLEKWLYHERYLVDGWDKMMNIYRASDEMDLSPVKERYAKSMETRGRELLGEEFDLMVEGVRQRLIKGESLKNSQLTKEFGVIRPGSYSNYQLLDYLFFLGEAQIHTKNKGQKVYRLGEKPPLRALDDSFFDWYTLRRVKATGLIRAGRSDAWLGYWIYYPEWRNPAISRLLEKDLLQEVQVEGVKGRFLIPSEMREVLENTQPTKTMVRFLAPLDNLVWDRKLLHDIFDFYYRWEVYVPKAKRQWGYYVLPILAGSRLIGRIEPIRTPDGGLEVKHVWWEDKAKVPKAAYQAELKSFERYLSR